VRYAHLADPRDKRLRTSAMIEIDGKVLVHHFRCRPDFRYQMLRRPTDPTRCPACSLHGHRDHIAGLDDIRPFNYLQGQIVDLYCDRYAEAMIREQFAYAFNDREYAFSPRMNFHRIHHEPFQAAGISIIPIEVMHYKLPVRAFRVGDFTYITDAKTISDAEKEKLKGTKTLVVNALHAPEHIAHCTVQEALALVEESSLIWPTSHT
jgi:phosphoribosyl 1,2-cyclic phosphate phosphodiesterase